MRLTLSSYSLKDLIKNKIAADITELPKFAAELGFEGFEVVASAEEAFEKAPAIKEACDRAGLTITSVCVGADFLANDVAEQVATLHKAVDACVILHAPLLRHDATSGFTKDHHGIRDFAHALPRLAEGYLAVTQYAAGLGIKTAVENHGFFCQDSERVELLIDTVNHPNFGALVDIGNFLCADEDPLKAVARLAPLALHAHAKDFHIKYGGDNPGHGWFGTRGGNWLRGAIIGHGNLPIAQLLGILHRAGYDGWLALEYEGIEDCMLAVRDGKRNLDDILLNLNKS